MLDLIIGLISNLFSSEYSEIVMKMIKHGVLDKFNQVLLHTKLKTEVLWGLSNIACHS